jgi:hypothetical protein
VRSMSNWDCKDESKLVMAMEFMRHLAGDLGGTDTCCDEWPTTSDTDKAGRRGSSSADKEHEHEQPEREYEHDRTAPDDQGPDNECV